MSKVDALYLFLVLTNGISFAQKNVVCIKHKECLAYTTDTSNQIYTKICVVIDSDRTSTINIPKIYYVNADSIVIKVRELHTPYNCEKLQVSYCYKVGPHYLSLYLSPTDFPFDCSKYDDYFYTIDMYYKTHHWYGTHAVPYLQSREKATGKATE